MCTRDTGKERIRCFLQVDFDNCYLSLGRVDKMAGEDFARHPDRWLRRLLGAISNESDANARRDVLVRRAYLNPGAFGRYRLPFVRAGFEVVDCPVLTQSGKTAADMIIAAELIEAVHHSTRFDEFILLSADTDFTPILQKARLYDRRTVAVAAQKLTASYAAVCDQVIGPSEFRKVIGPDLLVLPRPDDAA
jgi:hypothetical protein